MKESIITTVTHQRRGKTIKIENVAGTIKIVGQRILNKKSKDLVEIEVSGTAATHDSLQIKGTKGRISVINQSPNGLADDCVLQLFVPSGITLALSNISGTVIISETIETLSIASLRPCQIFTETLYGASFNISAGVDIKVRRLVGHCRIIAGEGAEIEVREATINTLNASLYNGARVSMYGSTRFARLFLSDHTRCRLGNIELLKSDKEQSAILNVDWLHRISDERRVNLTIQAYAEMERFSEEIAALA